MSFIRKAIFFMLLVGGLISAVTGAWGSVLIFLGIIVFVPFAGWLAKTFIGLAALSILVAVVAYMGVSAWG